MLLGLLFWHLLPPHKGTSPRPHQPRQPHQLPAVMVMVLGWQQPAALWRVVMVTVMGLSPVTVLLVEVRWSAACQQQEKARVRKDKHTSIKLGGWAAAQSGDMHVQSSIFAHTTTCHDACAHVDPAPVQQAVQAPGTHHYTASSGTKGVCGQHGQHGQR